MTTQATIDYCRKQDTVKMITRLRGVDLRIIPVDYDFFSLYGINESVTDSGLIMSPNGNPAWSISQLHNLLALIFSYGRQSKYSLTLRQGIAQFKLEILVPASADPREIANDLAAGRRCEVHELIEVI